MRSGQTTNPPSMRMTTGPTVEIRVNEVLQALPRETRLQHDDEESDSGSSDDDDDDDDMDSNVGDSQRGAVGQTSDVKVKRRTAQRSLTITACTLKDYNNYGPKWDRSMCWIISSTYRMH